MHLVFVYGAPAVGKYTVARELAELSGLPLFHNHLVVDAVGSVFPFGSEAFTRLREQFWMDVFDAACTERRSMIFTFQPESTVSADFADRVARQIEMRGGSVSFVRLTVSVDEQIERIANVDRERFGKLRDAGILTANLEQFAACEAAMPEPMITIDTGLTAPSDAARLIWTTLNSGESPACPCRNTANPDLTP